MLYGRSLLVIFFVYSTVLCLVPQSCLTLCNTVDCSPPVFSVHRILQVRILEWVAMPSSRGSFQPRDIEHMSPESAALQADSLRTGPPGKPVCDHLSSI